MGGVIHDFKHDLDWSKGTSAADDQLTILNMLDGCQKVEISSNLLDLSGVDYVATLRNGAAILIDGKTRKPGCSKFWRMGPELALETWSVKPGGKYRMADQRKKIGWTLCEHKRVDFILFKFDPADCEIAYLICFQLLRIAFRRNHKNWYRCYKVDIQDNRNFESEAVFVPATVVLKAVSDAGIGRLKMATKPTLPEYGKDQE
jgi:hypothetical protein